MMSETRPILGRRLCEIGHLRPALAQFPGLMKWILSPTVISAVSPCWCIQRDHIMRKCWCGSAGVQPFILELHMLRQVLAPTGPPFLHLLTFLCLPALASGTWWLREASLLGRSLSAQSGQESFTWWHSKASGATATAAADDRQGHLALSPCPGPVLATQPVNIDSVARKWKAEMTTLAHSKGRSSSSPDKTRCSYATCRCVTN